MRAYAVYFTESSVRYAVCRPLRGTAYGSIREICYVQPAPRHSTRTRPKDMPSLRLSAAKHTEPSENHAVCRHLRGTAYGIIRKNYHFCPHLRSNKRKHPRKLPRASCFAARFTETSANCATAGERSVQKAAQCRRTQKVGHAYAFPTLTNSKHTASCADAPHAAH